MGTAQLPHVTVGASAPFPAASSTVLDRAVERGEVARDAGGRNAAVAPNADFFPANRAAAPR
jgi:hypothetical protein